MTAQTAKVLSGVYDHNLLKSPNIFDKYLTEPILEKKHKGAKAVTKASVANNIKNVFLLTLSTLLEIFDRTHTEEKT